MLTILEKNIYIYINIFYISFLKTICTVCIGSTYLDIAIGFFNIKSLKAYARLQLKISIYDTQGCISFTQRNYNLHVNLQIV